MIKNLPIKTYSVRKTKPNKVYGSPAVLLIDSAQAEIMASVSFVDIPAEATISKATIKIYADRAAAGAKPIVFEPITSPWNSSVHWNKAQSVGLGASLGTVTINDPAAKALYSLDVTLWAQGRPIRGFKMRTTTAAQWYLKGSSSSTFKPVLEVEYNLAPLAPSNLKPTGGAVSVPKPNLTMALDAAVTHIEVEITKGATVWTSGQVPHAFGEGFVQPAGAPNLADTEGVTWRARQWNAQGVSPWSAPVAYTYRPLPAADILLPDAVTADGSPTMSWDAPAQVQWAAALRDRDTNQDIDSSNGYKTDAAERFWTPKKGVKVPGGRGRMYLWVKDGHIRVEASGAPVATLVTQDFTTSLDGAGTGMDTLDIHFDGDSPIPRFTGSRFEIPDEIKLVRDGVVVPLWNADGDVDNVFPGSDFFDIEGNFELRDYTAEPHVEHTWKVLAVTDGVPSSVNPTVTARIENREIWLLNPLTDERIAIQGENGVPVVSQTVEEAAIVHTPVIGEGVVEPVRRRLMRTTRSGSITGIVTNDDGRDDEGTLERWIDEEPGSTRYRLIFGKVNWPVIIGDYVPTEVLGYDGKCDPTRVGVNLNWWERLRDF